MRERFTVPLVHAFLGGFLHVPWPGIERATPVHWGDALTNWATQQGKSPLLLSFLFSFTFLPFYRSFSSHPRYPAGLSGSCHKGPFSIHTFRESVNLVASPFLQCHYLKLCQHKIIFVKFLLWPRHCTKFVTGLILFIPHNHLIRLVLLGSPVYSLEPRPWGGYLFNIISSEMIESHAKPALFGEP